MVVVVACVFLLLHLLRIVSRNEGKLHGGGFDGADSAFGYPPLGKTREEKGEGPEKGSA
jgi:hypothetical protein